MALGEMNHDAMADHKQFPPILVVFRYTDLELIKKVWWPGLAQGQTVDMALKHPGSMFRA